jgi:hypothetical protein
LVAAGKRLLVDEKNIRQYNMTTIGKNAEI